MLNAEPELKASYVAAGQLSLAFHHIIEVTSTSLTASTAVECAGEQSPLDFWQMHDLLFARQGDFWNAPTDAFVLAGSELGLDGPALRACMDAGNAQAKAQRMDQERRDQGILRRPTLAINGTGYPGAVPLAQLQAIIDPLLAP